MRGYSEIYKKILNQIAQIAYLLGEAETFYLTNVFADYRISKDHEIGNFNIIGFNKVFIKDKEYLKLILEENYGIDNENNKNYELLLTEDNDSFIKTDRKSVV